MMGSKKPNPPPDDHFVDVNNMVRPTAPPPPRPGGHYRSDTKAVHGVKPRPWGPPPDSRSVGEGGSDGLPFYLAFACLVSFAMGMLLERFF